MKDKAKNLAALTLIAVAVAVTSPAAARVRPFSFRTVEFMPRDQREAAAAAFVGSAIRPGLSGSEARLRLRRAGLSCHRAIAAQLACTTNSLERHPGHDLTDVVWTVSVSLGNDGNVVKASVARTTAGV